MKLVLSLCTYLCAQIGSSLYPLIAKAHLQIQAECEKKKLRLCFKILTLDIVLLTGRMEDDAEMSVTAARMVLSSAVLTPDFPLTRRGNSLPEHLNDFFFFLIMLSLDACWVYNSVPI